MNAIPANLSKNCRDFIQKVLTPNPDKRPSVNEILQHKWLKESIDYRYMVSFAATKVAKTEYIVNWLKSTIAWPRMKRHERSIQMSSVQ